LTTTATLRRSWKKVASEADKDGNMHETWYDDSCRDDE
jgi:hypothetical protein